MNHRGLTVYRYQGIYSQPLHFSDATPAKLGYKLVQEIPEDPREFETWKNRHIKRLNFEQRNRVKSIKNSGYPVAFDRDLPSAFPTYIDDFVIWAYIIDLDSDVFIVCNGNEDSRRLYLNLRYLPRGLFLRHDWALMQLKRPSIENGHDGEGGLEIGHLAAAYYDTASLPQLLPRNFVQYIAANKQDIEYVKEMIGDVNISKNRSNLAAYLLHCFVSCYKDFFEYQRGKYEKSGFISRKLAIAVLSYLSYGAGIGRLYSWKYTPPVKKEIPIEYRYRILPFEADSTPWWNVPSRTSNFFWLTEKVLVLVEDGPLREGDHSKTSAVGRVCLNIKNRLIPDKPSRFPDNSLGKEYFVIVLSNSLDSIFFMKLTRPERQSDPIETTISPVLQFIPYYFWCLEHEKGIIQPGIISCMEFIAHAHPETSLPLPRELDQQVETSSRLLSLAPEILHRIMELCPYSSFVTLSQTSRKLRSFCNSITRIGNLTLQSINLEIKPTVIDRYVLYQHSIEANCTLQSCYEIDPERNVRLATPMDDIVDEWDPDEAGINAAEVEYRRWRKRLWQMRNNPTIGMAQGPVAPFVAPTFRGRMFRNGDNEKAFGAMWRVDVGSTPYLAPLRIHGIELKTVKVVEEKETSIQNLDRTEKAEKFISLVAYCTSAITYHENNLVIANVASSI